MNNNLKNLRLAISCGGTGGHFYPGLSIARELTTKGGKAILLISGTNSIQQQAIAKSYNIEAIALPQMENPKRNISKFFKGFYKGYKISKNVLLENNIHAILGMGSFASLPPILAAKKLKLPLFLHDGNARVGKANRILSRYAVKLWSAFDIVNQDKIKSNSNVSGMPLRPEIIQSEKLDKQQAIQSLNQNFNVNLSNDLTTILIFGGSQGAEIFNKTLPLVLKKLSDKFNFQVLHLTGKNKLDYTLENYQNCNFSKLVIESSEKMELFYQAADLIFSRSGGSSVAEIAYFGKASLLVPYPFAAENHQYDNAKYLAENGAAKIIDNTNCNENTIIEAISNLLEDKNTISLMQEKAKLKAKLNVANNILDEINSHFI